MKNVLLIINILLIVLVGYLFYYVFSKDKSAPKKQPIKVENNNPEAASAPVGQIAYIELDSLEANYEFYQKVKSDYERKQKAAENEILSLQKKYQARTEQLQQQAATMTPEQQEKAMMEINKMQQDFQTRRETLDKDLFDFNTKTQKDVLKKIEVFLKEFNKDGKYAYILSYEPGFMFYKDSTMNITPEVVQGLNAEYTASKK